MTHEQTDDHATPEAHARPLVTFALFAYNQERFVEEAVHAALAQTYAPLQIILSDDGSSDATFDIIESLAASYQGPHDVLVNRNDSNLGIGAHVNRVVRLTRGELLVAAAADDVSLPQRVERLVEAWLSGDKAAASLYSAARIIDATGAEHDVAGDPPPPFDPAGSIRTYMHGVQGCSHAWARRVFEVFGPFLPDTVCEDRVIPLRSELLGGVHYCPEVLVKYRQHDGGVSQHGGIRPEDIMARTCTIHRRNLNIADNYVRDLDFARRSPEMADIPWLETAHSSAQALRDQAGAKVRFHEGNIGTKLGVILDCLWSDPMRALRFAAILAFPGRYTKNQIRNLKGT